MLAPVDPKLVALVPPRLVGWEAIHERLWDFRTSEAEKEHHERVCGRLVAARVSGTKTSSRPRAWAGPSPDDRVAPGP